MPNAGIRYESVIMNTIMPWSTLPSVATTAIFLPQNMGSTSQMEWAANPLMVSSHRTEILILFVITDIIKSAAKVRQINKVRNT
jgi:hypothetical protein